MHVMIAFAAVKPYPYAVRLQGEVRVPLAVVAAPLELGTRSEVA